jgi:hypothetical protein
MPVWHVSVARISKDRSRIVPVSEWRPGVFLAARELQRQALSGAGADWQLEEIGLDAIHLRRRLSAPEIRCLYQAHPTCPVFTHGAAGATLGL